MPVWNPWHGCHKLSPGCKNCYVYRRDKRYDKDSSAVTKNAEFDLPIRRDRYGIYKLRNDERREDNTVYACMTSDFFLDDADPWRPDCWAMIKRRSDLRFLIITKRIHRFEQCMPSDWGDGYDNVAVCCTCENQDRADFRLPIFLSLPIKHKLITCEPLLERIDLSRYLNGDIEHVTAGGESGEEARLCRYEWILSIREQCVRAGVSFWFKQTGAVFEKDGRVYRIERRLQSKQARRAGINYRFG